MKVKNWLMDMQDTAYTILYGLETGYYHDEAEARAAFLRRYPHQERVFDDCKTEWSER